MATKGVTVDEAFLRDFLAKGGKAETPTGTPIADSNVNEFLQEEHTAFVQAGQDKETKEKIKAATANDRAAKLHAKAEAASERTAEQEQKAAQMRAESEARDQAVARDQAIRATETFAGQARQATENALAPAKNIADKVAATRLPDGGIGLLLAIIAILLFTVVVVNQAGDTRLKQLWYLLNSRTGLIGRKILVPAPPLDTAAEIATLANDAGTVAADIVGTLTGLSPAGAAGVVAGTQATLGLDSSFRNLP